MRVDAAAHGAARHHAGAARKAEDAASGLVDDRGVAPATTFECVATPDVLTCIAGHLTIRQAARLHRTGRACRVGLREWLAGAAWLRDAGLVVERFRARPRGRVGRRWAELSGPDAGPARWLLASLRALELNGAAVHARELSEARACRLPQLEALHAMGCRLGDAAAARLIATLGDAAPELRRLILSVDNEIGDGGAAALGGAAARGGLARLETLALVANRVGERGAAALGRACGEGALARLAVLNLDDNRVGDAGVLALVAGFARARTRLRALGLAQNGLSDVGLGALVRACGRGALSRLAVLRAHGNRAFRLRVADAAEPTRGALASVRALHLAYNHVDGAGAAALADAIRNGRLQSLLLGCNFLGDAGAEALASAGADGALAQLTTLRLDQNGIGDAGADALAKVGHRLPRLARLSLSRNCLADAGVAALARGLPCLRELLLAANWMGDDGLRTLVGGGPTGLRTLDLAFNRIGNAGCAALLAASATVRWTCLVLVGNPIDPARLAACGEAGVALADLAVCEEDGCAAISA